MATDLSSLPRIRLGQWPSPRQACPRLSDRLGTRVLVKRDDVSLIGDGSIAADETVLFLHTGGLPGLFAYIPEATAALGDQCPDGRGGLPVDHRWCEVAW